MKRNVFIIIMLTFFISESCKTTYRNTGIISGSAVSTKAETVNRAISKKPPGVSVDSHGRRLDTDGDGVSDFKDKELLTLNSCFPVDSDGIGNCPDPLCCGGTFGHPNLTELNVTPPIADIVIRFADKSKVVTKSEKSKLEALAMLLRANPWYYLRCEAPGGLSERSLDLSWSRLNAIIRYLVDQKGIFSR